MVESKEDYLEESSPSVNKVPIGIPHKNNILVINKGKPLFEGKQIISVPKKFANAKGPVNYISNGSSLVIPRSIELKGLESNHDGSCNSDPYNEAKKSNDIKLDPTKYPQLLFKIKNSDEVSIFESTCTEITLEYMRKIIKCGVDCYPQVEEAVTKKKDLLYNTISPTSQEEMQKKKASYSRRINDPKKEKTLVLELQSVLQFITTINVDQCDAVIPTYKGKHFICYLYVINRQNLADFLTEMYKHYELIVFSEMLDDHVNAICEYLEEDLSIKFEYAFGSSHSIYKNSTINVKKLEMLIGSRKRENIIVVDYNLINSCFQIAETLIVPKFTGKEDAKDVLKCLAKALLMCAHKSESVKNILSPSN